MKTSEILVSTTFINKLAACKTLPASAAMKVALVLKKIAPIIKSYEDTRATILDKYTTKDADGKPITAFEENQDGSLKKDGEGNPIVIPGAVKLTDPKAFNAELTELLDTEVADPAGGITIPITAITTVNASPEELLPVLWLFSDG